MTVTKIPTHPRYATNFQGETKASDVGPCVVCGKAVKAPGTYFVHEVDGGGFICTPDDDERYSTGIYEGGDLGLQPIGSDCVRQHPELRPYIRRRR